MIENPNRSKKDKPLTIFITGGSSGIGYQAVLKLISIGNSIILPCKNILRANEVLTNIFNQLPCELSKKGNIPVTTTLHGLGVYDEREKLSLKMVGMHGSYTANKSIQESDCILALGSRFDDRTIGKLEYYAPEAKKASKNKIS